MDSVMVYDGWWDLLMIKLGWREAEVVKLPPRNRSGLHPKGHAVLVQAYEPEMKRAAEESLIVIPEQVQESTDILENRVRVIEIGSSSWDGEREPRAKVGDIVLVTRLAGFRKKGNDGKLYRLVNDRDIFCVCDAGEE